MAIIETWFKQDLAKAVSVQSLNGSCFTEDNEGNLIGVSCFRNGEEETLSGTVSGYVIREDNQTVVVTDGTLSSNKASILLPSEAVSVPGMISVVIRLTNGDEKTVLCAVRATVVRSRSDTIITPSGQTIYGIDEMLAQIAACEGATRDATAAATAANTAASEANTKANLANEKAELANTKANLANEKATAAETQANRAKGYADAFENVTTVTGAAGTQASVVVDTTAGTVTFTIPRGVDGTGAVSTVEGISPDGNHNVSLDTLIVSQSAVETMVDGLFT